MILRIFLANDILNLFRIAIPQTAPCREVLDRASLLGNTRVVECELSEAVELLEKAKAFCPMAVERIAEAISRKRRVAQKDDIPAFETPTKARSAQGIRRGPTLK